MFWSLFYALLYASAAYGIQRRVPVVWKLGWAVSHHFLSTIYDWRTVLRTETARSLDWRCRNPSWGRIDQRLLGPMVESAKRLLPHRCPTTRSWLTGNLTLLVPPTQPIGPWKRHPTALWPELRSRKNAVKSPATAAGSSTGAKCPPRGKTVQRWMLYTRSRYERGGSPSGTV
jgi:hypothetical protein